MSNEDIAALGERISRLERVVTALSERADLAIADLAGDTGSGSGFAKDGGATGFGSTNAPAGFASIDAERDPEILELIQRDKLINAIKRYRELTGTGLHEAKDAVERIAAEQRLRG